MTRLSTSSSIGLPLAILCAALVAISCGGPFFRLANAPPLAAAAWRVLLAAMVAAPFALRAGLIADVRGLPSRERWLLLGAGLALAAHFGLWVPSLGLTSISSSVVLVTTSPLLVGLLSARVLGERPGAALAMGTLVAFMGAVVIAGGDAGRGGHAVLGDLLALGGAGAAAVYFLIGRLLRRRLSTLTYVFAAYAVSGIVLAVVGAAVGQPLYAVPSSAWPWLILLALVPQLVGHSGLNWALSRLSAAYVSAVTLGEPIGSTLLAWWWLGERPHASTLAGGGLILSGLAVATRAEMRARHRRRGAAAGGDGRPARIEG